jgi:hypothetical protein
LRRNCLLKHVVEGQIEGKMYVTGRRGRNVKSSWMTLRKVKCIGKSKRKNYVTLYGEHALESAVDFLKSRITS